MEQSRPEQPKRKSIPKRIRFEVFKRDSFTCQYCGASAPDVLLQIDHIKPVADGGTNDITNLVAACAGCNAGKGARNLDDSSTVKRRKAQLDELQERREQLEMMTEWMAGLQGLKEQAVDHLAEYWSNLAPGRVPNEMGRRNLKKWLRKYSLHEITQAMDVAAEQYLEFNRNGDATAESWEKGFDKIPAICQVERDSKEDPDIKELLYIMGIVRNKCANYFDKSDCLGWLKAARSWEVPMSELRQIALRTRYWSHFVGMIEQIIEDYKA